MSNEIEKKLWKKTKRYLRFLQIVPFLQLVSVCNNLAYGKVDEESDIDLFIVAKSGRLFTTRLFVTFLLHVLGVRRHGDKVFGRFCLSFFVDDSALDMSSLSIYQDIYLAFWIKSMKPLIVSDNFSVDSFLKSNSWAFSYFENAEDFSIDKSRFFSSSFFTKGVRGFFGLILKGRFGDFIENKLKKWQLSRSSKKAELLGEESSVVVSDHVLKFHNIDRREEYRNAWFKKYGDDAKLTEEKFLLL